MTTSPNPTADRVTVEVPAPWGNDPVHYRVLSSVGRVVLETQSAQGSTSLNLAQLANGIYILVAEQNGKVLRTKINKQ